MTIRNLYGFLLFLLVFASPHFLFSQNKVPVSDPQAVALAAKAVAAMSGTTPITDVTLTGDVTRILGSDKQTGTATLVARGLAESRIDLAMGGGALSEVRNASAGPIAGNWHGPDGVPHPIAVHNCFTDASWFFPALGSLAGAATDPNVVLTYLGQEDQQQSSFQHIQAYSYNPYLHAVQALSTMDFYLDAQTLLPSIVMFNDHPDTDQTVNIAVQVMFSDYRSVGGAQIPFHIQRYVNDSLMLDVQITSASINTGVSDSNFSVQ
jgi:hypothetical protein